ncbi:PREDICTED: uncharacterized protein LOC104604277 isoform X2 [Nelumbo nucifera]|uniref:Uncharacterized protein LOC104604277 isoform X2 n=1 Tax=Nelumbo nucifera TaxID=4432 RepID=A0A1U8AV94_NELNU|nr:PREDICTED: uncharacterized protein LOC104604277 isoform X2 [Nelumbo nucifera]
MHRIWTDSSTHYKKGNSWTTTCIRGQTVLCSGNGRLVCSPGSICYPNSHYYQSRAKQQESDASLVTDAFTSFKHLLLPITDRNPYLSDGTRLAAATTAALAKKYGADITVVVIDENPKESFPEHDTQLSSIRWHLSEGGFQEFKLIERLGEGNKPTAIIGEVADDLNLDLVVISMEAIHSKLIDANLLAEFIPCPVLLLPL